jgi:hypothetical protein
MYERLKTFLKTELDLRIFDETEAAGLKLGGVAVDLSGEEWNARITADGLLNCLNAEVTANGLLMTNDIAEMMIVMRTWREGKKVTTHQPQA